MNRSAMPGNSHERAFYQGVVLSFYHQDPKDGLHRLNIPDYWYDEEAEKEKEFDVFKLMACFEDDFHDDGGQLWYFGLEGKYTLVGACIENDNAHQVLEYEEGDYVSKVFIIMDVWEIARQVRDWRKLSSFKGVSNE